MGRREVFDPARAFAVNRPFPWGGRVYSAGEVFDQRSDQRRLRQLYDNRYLRMLPEDQVPDDGRPRFSLMEEADLRAWMRAHNVEPHQGLDKVRLLKKCTLLWMELKAGVRRPAKVMTDAIDASWGPQPNPQGDSEGVQEPAGAGPPEEGKPRRRGLIRRPDNE